MKSETWMQIARLTKAACGFAERMSNIVGDDEMAEVDNAIDDWNALINVAPKVLKTAKLELLAEDK
jgi:hypothetical protein